MADPTTTRLALPYPIGSDPANVPTVMQALAVQADAITVGFKSGTHSARPAAGVNGFIYYESDTGHVFYDNGSQWIAMTPEYLAETIYPAPGSTGINTSNNLGHVSVAWAAVDATNLTATLIVPPSGNYDVLVESYVSWTTNSAILAKLGIILHGTTTLISDPMVVANVSGTANGSYFFAKTFRINGRTPGASEHIDLGYFNTGSGTTGTTMYEMSQDQTAPSNTLIRVTPA